MNNSKKTKRRKTELQILREKNLYQVQDFEQPENEEQKRFTRITHYMLHHQNYIKLSNSAKILLMYMKDWAFASEEFARKQTFDFSTTMLERIGVMARKTTMSALRELEHYGFIQKENNATKESGITQKWSFSKEWYTGIKGKYKSVVW